MLTLEQYRENAAECRRLAAMNPGGATACLETAKIWERLAQERERTIRSQVRREVAVAAVEGARG